MIQASPGPLDATPENSIPTSEPEPTKVSGLNLHLHTVGNSPASVVLIDKLNREIQDPSLSKAVVKYIHTTQTGFARLAELEDTNWFNRFRILWAKERMAKALFHPEIDTYICNVIKTDSKEWLRSTLTPKQRAKLPRHPKTNRDGKLIP